MRTFHRQGADMTDTLTGEIDRASRLARQMIAEYAAWSDKVKYGDQLHDAYREVFDFVNFRIETADSCLSLLHDRHVADALGLCRSLLENYLLFMLMCRGAKFFELQDTHLTGAKFKKELEDKQAEIKQLHEEGKTPCIGVEEYPRRKGFLMYLYEGLNSPDPDLPEFRIPVHHFLFRQFNPETMRLKDENYFRYYEPTLEVIKADHKQHLAQEDRYRFYLSYDALLQCLELNGLADDALQARIEAHYVFLGKFLHPTHEAARELHESPNCYDGRTRIGLGQRYTEYAVLLGYLYVCYLLAATLDEAAGRFEQAPAKYITDSGTTSLRAVTGRIPVEFPYFWFLTNDPPLWDRYNHCTYHENEADVASWGGYEHVPFDQVYFDQHIYSHLKKAYGFWKNA